jgi:hypothetical protein
MPDIDPGGGASVDLSGVEQRLQDISDNLGSGDEKLFTDCALRLFVNCNFDESVTGKSAMQQAQQCIDNALMFVTMMKKTKDKYFPKEE